MGCSVGGVFDEAGMNWRGFAGCGHVGRVSRLEGEGEGEREKENGGCGDESTFETIGLGAALVGRMGVSGCDLGRDCGIGRDRSHSLVL